MFGASRGWHWRRCDWQDGIFRRRRERHAESFEAMKRKIGDLPRIDAHPILPLLASENEHDFVKPCWKITQRHILVVVWVVIHGAGPIRPDHQRFVRFHVGDVHFQLLQCIISAIPDIAHQNSPALWRDHP